MRREFVFMAVALLFAGAYYFFTTALTERSATAALTASKAVRPSTSFAFSIVLFSAAVAGVFYAISGSQPSNPPALTPSRQEAAFSSDELFRRLTAPAEKTGKPVKERYSVDEDFSQSGYRNRF
ncbi:MAG: hypothetical protein V1708_01830 [Candidatus Micrarchaeota archaeon]